MYADNANGMGWDVAEVENTVEQNQQQYQEQEKYGRGKQRTEVQQSPKVQIYAIEKEGKKTDYRFYNTNDFPGPWGKCNEDDLFFIRGSEESFRWKMEESLRLKGKRHKSNRQNERDAGGSLSAVQGGLVPSSTTVLEVDLGVKKKGQPQSSDFLPNSLVLVENGQKYSLSAFLADSSEK
ncbi:hypothetical protein K435DRAFT_800847 [Dendrothele bispora CBS 962.96]|uniref:Uncharacterized protein n=1 Tax=Dendrothele bispora (strain CBS 962.96) TaxID=1314807 RepID=A0A4S8LRY9_DENBC|nr:hypothetical protein K435DRAFT_800847 [Dendrothele bispora CBS 962.96]